MDKISIYQPMIDLVKDLYGDDISDEILVDYLFIEFGVEVTVEELKEHYQKVVATEEEDYRLIASNMVSMCGEGNYLIDGDDGSHPMSPKYDHSRVNSLEDRCEECDGLGYRRHLGEDVTKPCPICDGWCIKIKKDEVGD